MNGNIAVMNQPPLKSRTGPSLILKFLLLLGADSWMIEIAAILSALVHHRKGLGIILALLMVNSLVGFCEEYQAGNVSHL